MELVILVIHSNSLNDLQVKKDMERDHDLPNQHKAIEETFNPLEKNKVRRQ